MELEAPRFDYDVFLSFRGSDTRQAFASVLYDYMVRAGIRVFKDDDELIVGDKIETILEAIHNSELCVPIFSKTFASSKWCLEEVGRMVRLEKVICPIFYKVSVQDVKLKTPTYVELMEKLETNKEKIEEWKDALIAATGFTGQILVDQSYPDFCKDFISDVLKKLKPRDQFVSDNFIRVDDQLDRFTELLDVKSADIRYLSIHGMGGIGKTTLAKVIYNKFKADFDCHSFIENIGERSLAANWGLIKLEEEHWANLDRTCKREFDSSRGLDQRLHRKKVLIVLDDVVRSEQIEKLAGKSSLFGPGSRIVVTTRDIRVLKKCGKLKKEEIFPFEMETLKFHHALQLFISHAFTEESAPLDFLSLSEEAVSTTRGLPLALVVLGSLLRNEDDKGVWKDIIEKSKKVGIDEVKDRLKISYDKLEDEQKEIFLDIACLSVCTDKSKVFNMWEASKFSPTYGLRVLQYLSLIKMKDNNEIWMHDMLRELGRDIVRGKSNLPIKRSRLWEHDEALEVLKSKSEKEKIQAISLDKSSKVTLTREQLDTLKTLRFLELGEAELEGDLNNVLPNLRWLSWSVLERKKRWFSWRSRSGFSASNFSLPNLVSLFLSSSSITESWHGWSLLQGAKNLKDLCITGCSKLTKTPKFPEHMILERLVLRSCDRLAAVDSIGSLGKLQRLALSYCCTLKTLPPSIGSIKSLIELDLSKTAITELPDSIGSLENLEELRVDCCELRNLPLSLNDLGKLKVLHAGSNRLLEELPEDIGRLGKLQRLNLSSCSTLKTLPASIGNIRSLIELHLSRTAITELPDSIGSLKNLRELRVDHCKLRNLPWRLSDLGKLEVLDAGSNESLEELPSSISQLSSLKTLNLESCDLLQELPKLPTSLSELSIISRSLKKVADLSSMVNLVDLCIMSQSDEEVETSNLNLIEQLIKLKRVWLHLQLQKSAPLPANFSRLTRLENLHLLCRNLKDPLQLPSSLSNLVLVDFNSEEILRIEDLHSLKELMMYGCNFALDGLHLPQNLTILELWDCEKLTEIHGLGKSKFLRQLVIDGCGSLKRLENLSELEFLERLLITNCKALEGIEGIDYSKWKKVPVGPRKDPSEGYDEYGWLRQF